MATLYRLLIALNGMEGPAYYQAGDGNMKAGYLCMEDDADEVKIWDSTSGDPREIVGVVGAKADQDLNTAYSAGERIPVWLIGSGVELYILHDGNSAETIKKGLPIMASTSEDGKVRLKPDYTTKDTTTYFGTQFSETADTENQTIGWATERVTITSGTDKYIKVLLK